MRNKGVSYLIASAIFSLLTVGYAAVITVDFIAGYTPGYLIVLHIMTAIVSFAAAVVNFKRYGKQRNDKKEHS